MISDRTRILCWLDFEQDQEIINSLQSIVSDLTIFMQNIWRAHRLRTRQLIPKTAES